MNKNYDKGPGRLLKGMKHVFSCMYKILGFIPNISGLTLMAPRNSGPEQHCTVRFMSSTIRLWR